MDAAQSERASAQGLRKRLFNGTRLEVRYERKNSNDILKKNNKEKKMDENCYVEPINKTTSADQIRKADSALLAVSGMGCENCAMRVRNSLLSLEGVYEADVYLNMAMAEVSYDSNKVAAGMLVDAVSRAGNDGRHEYRAELVAA